MCAIFGLIDYNHTLNAKQREKSCAELPQLAMPLTTMAS